MQATGDTERLCSWRGTWSETAFLAALTGGGDSRLAIDPATGTNRYFVPPQPDEAGVCFSSCTASPISPAGYRRARRCYVDLVGARSSSDAAKHVAEWTSEVEVRLAAYLGATGLASIVLLPSGTDGLLLCAILLSLEAGGRPMTAILPAAAETGTGVPRAAVRQAFDDLCGGGGLPEAVEVALRTPEGAVRAEDAVGNDFAAAAKSSTGRPVAYLTYGSKTGLVAPLRAPSGAEVVVDACQLRLAPSVVQACLRQGWPVVVTGSKYLGGPPFSGAVLLPHGRCCGHTGGGAGAVAAHRRGCRCRRACLRASAAVGCGHRGAGRGPAERRLRDLRVASNGGSDVRAGECAWCAPRRRTFAGDDRCRRQMSRDHQLCHRGPALERGVAVCWPASPLTPCFSQSGCAPGATGGCWSFRGASPGLRDARQGG